MEIKLDNGKYTIIQKENGSLEALRHGERWRDLTGDNLIFYMAHTIEEQQELIWLLANAIKPFARFSCDETPCDCHNCRAKNVLNHVEVVNILRDYKS